MEKLSLVVVGTGIRTVGQLTVESIAWMRMSDRLLYVVGDPVAETMLHDLNPEGAESLQVLYADGKPRIETYNAMIERILECVRNGERTCAVFYGHPGVFVYPSHEAVRRARAEGYQARMLPGVSAEDCLFADLGVDPAMTGCQSYEATDFLINGRRIDPSSAVILWQIGVVGDDTYKTFSYDLSALPLLLQRLYRQYRPDHRVFVYEAATYPGCEPIITEVPLFRLRDAGLTASSTLYIPPAVMPRPNVRLYQMLGLSATEDDAMGAHYGQPTIAGSVSRR